MSVLEDIKEAWSWVGLEPKRVVAMNEFGNLLIEDARGRYWRLCPEDVYCKVVAESNEAYESLLKNYEFTSDWEMVELVRKARAKLGPLPEGHRFCLKIPALLGGTYDVANIGTAPLHELVLFSGDLARKTKDLPEGTPIQLRVVD